MLRTVRTEVTDRVLISGPQRLPVVLDRYAAHYNHHRPHPARYLRSSNCDEEPPGRYHGHDGEYTADKKQPAAVDHPDQDDPRACRAVHWAGKRAKPASRRVIARHRPYRMMTQAITKSRTYFLCVP